MSSTAAVATGPTLSPPPAGPALPQGATRLPDWGLIRARGEDAATFLQGQLTNDVASLPEGRSRLAGYCSPKGRLLASFVIWRAAPDEWLLACSADVLPATLKRLSMFVMRARCKLSDASADLPLWGLHGAAAEAWLGAAAPAEAGGVARHGEAQVLRLADALGQARFLWAAPAGETPAGPAGLVELAPTAWRWLEVSSGVVRIVAATAEQFVPQMVNFELVGGVDFKKGCFPGQEVVARSQYRGTLKRRGVLLASAVPLVEGQEVFHDADPGQPAGTVALAAVSPFLSGTAVSVEGDAHLALVELKRAALGSGRLHLATADGPLLSPRPLPYELPHDDA